MISRIAVRLRCLRKKFNRTHWAASLLGIRSPAGEADMPGLVMIQLDGLARNQMERALAAGKLPFLAKLIERKHFTLESFYSGIPASTPAVQGELFYGIHAAVPSFAFLRRARGEVYRMNEAMPSAEIESELADRCPEPLLKGGCAYSNIYQGGALFSRYCAQDLAPEKFLSRLRPLRGLFLSILYAPKILRMAGLAVLEFGLAVLDMFKGLYQREDFFKELIFVPSRVLVCILLREMIRFRVLLDIERGVQVIHANFLGYDEQAHRRGPDSAFAHWTLRGIDRAVRDICRAAAYSTYRDYEWIIYSDHGQERSIPFPRKHGRSIAAAVREVFSHGPLAGTELWVSNLPDILGNRLERWGKYLGFKTTSRERPAEPKSQIILTAQGPVGHIYLPKRPSPADMESYARSLVEAGVPLVLLCRPNGVVAAFNRQGSWRLPEDRAEILGTEHRFLEETADDMVGLCKQPDAGDFVICGWDPHQAPVTFAIENGAHAGPGFEETHGFLLIPDRIRRWHVSHLSGTHKRVRGEDLRKTVLHYLGRAGIREERVPEYPPRDRDLPIRVMTYNIHSCLGIDGKVRPERIARVINYCNPDIVAVQEVDAHRARSCRHDQAQVIADHLRMTHVFQSMLEEEAEHYGIAIFAKHPFDIVKAELLTPASHRPFREARGAIWIRLEITGHQPFHFINTHFGLGRGERLRQAEELLGSNWLGSIPDTEPVIVCGDFNSGPRSKVSRSLHHRLRDAQTSFPKHKPRPTFPSVKPLMRIDHVLVSPHFEVQSVELPDTPTARIASDHLPLCAELSLRPSHEVA